MNVKDLSTNQQYPDKKPKISLTSWIRNQIANLYNAALAPVTATREVLAERLRNVCETVFSVHKKMMGIILSMGERT